jgi:hypothetical protein
MKMSEWGPANTFRDNKVHVAARKCSTCIYTKNSPVSVRRRNEMEREADRNESCITCHSTLDKEHQAVCAGYAARKSSMTLRLAELMGIIEKVEV